MFQLPIIVHLTRQLLSMGPSEAIKPVVTDQNPDSITENTIRTNSQSPNPRLNYVLERLVSHLHDFARETRLSTDEWMAGLKFLTEVGQKCSDVRQASSSLHA